MHACAWASLTLGCKGGSRAHGRACSPCMLRDAAPALTHAPLSCHTAAPRSQNAEIFTLTYGSIVRQLIADLEDLDEVNKQLDKMWVAEPGGGRGGGQGRDTLL